MNELKEKLRKFAEERNWNQFHNPKNLAMALGGEVGELLDLSQNSLLNSLHCQSNQLLFLDLKNGNNLNLGYGSIFTLSNPNLTCINVDDITYSVINWTYIDPQHYFSEYCP